VRPTERAGTSPNRARPRRVQPPSLLGSVAQGLREAAPPRFRRLEEYGPDGEIEEAWEGDRIAPGAEGVEAIIVTSHGYAEPRTDWQARGVVPPRGCHRSLVTGDERS
jgi:hypothetical protein